MPFEDDPDPTIVSGFAPEHSQPPIEKEMAPTQVIGFGESAGAVLGRYHLLQKIGEGGMGEVWLAEQRHPVRRRVALKLVKAGMNTREVIARFESERQALALMDHPAIAKVLDAGSTADGAPYFVMEYVAGVPITEYCDNHKLNMRERLELFIHVCEGVQHAHQKAIIHRDLKPSNILVTEVDGRAMPKIIDFGVAKALTQKLTEDTMFTRVGTMIGTPDYMSPEQANSSGEDIDTRTDVYSLGVVFYELLVGVPPLDLRRLALHQMLARLREEDAIKPSTKLRTMMGGQSTLLAQKRRTEPLALTRQIRGDLDSIALKALEKDRSRRYGSPSDFSADVGRYLSNEPVSAVPASTAYRARKLASRYRVLLITICAFMLVLILAAAVSIWQSIRATAQRDRADSEAAIAKAVNQFLQDDLLSQADSAGQGGAEVKPDPDIRVRTVLDRAAESVGKRFARTPLVESAVRRTIGSTYHAMGLDEKAEPQLRRAYELSRDHRGAEDLETIEILKVLSFAVQDLGRDAEGLSLSQQVVDLETRKLGPEDPRTLVAIQSLGVAYLFNGQYAKAEPLFRKALEAQERKLGYDNSETLDSSDSLATLYLDQGKYAEADVLLTKGLESYRRVFGPEHPFTVRERFGLARVLMGEGKYPESEKLFAEVLAANQRVKGPMNEDTLTIASMLGQAYTADGKLNQAIPSLEQTVHDFQQSAGAGSPRTLAAQQALAVAYDAHGELPRAEQIFKTVMEGYRKQGKGSEINASGSAVLLAQNLNKQNRFAEAELLLKQALKTYQSTNPGGWQRFRAEALYGQSLSGQKKYEEAEPQLLEGYAGLEKNRATMPASVRKQISPLGDQIVAMYSSWQKPEEAAKWRAKLSAPPAVP